MAAEAAISFLWVPARYGGHSGPPYEAMRTQVTWPKHPERGAGVLHDVEWSLIEIVADNQGTARIRFSASAIIEPGHIAEDEILEFRNGHRLLAIGRVAG